MFFPRLAATLFICIHCFSVLYFRDGPKTNDRDPVQTVQIATFLPLSCIHKIKCAVVASVNVKEHHFHSRSGIF